MRTYGGGNRLLALFFSLAPKSRVECAEQVVGLYVAVTERISRATSEPMSSSLRWRRNKHLR